MSSAPYGSYRPPYPDYVLPHDLNYNPYLAARHASQFNVPSAIPSAPPSYLNDQRYLPPHQASYYSASPATPPAPASFAPIAHYLHRRFLESERARADLNYVGGGYPNRDIVNSNFNHEWWHNSHNTYITHNHYYPAQQHQQYGARGGLSFSLPWPSR
jgi:hypothetical protein